MVSRNFILPESANYVFSYPFFFLRNLLYLISKCPRVRAQMGKEISNAPGGGIAYLVRVEGLDLRPGAGHLGLKRAGTVKNYAQKSLQTPAE